MGTNQSLPAVTDKDHRQLTKQKLLFANALASGDQRQVKLHLATYRTMGTINHRMVLMIPMDERIPALTSSPEGRNHVLTLLTAALQAAFSNLNLRFGLTADQIVELADQLIDSSHEDQLGLEDILLFLGDLLTGKAGKIYDRMDIPLFFELFEGYRQKRYETLKNDEYERDVQYRALPINDRLIDIANQEERGKNREAISAYLKTLPNGSDAAKG